MCIVFLHILLKSKLGYMIVQFTYFHGRPLMNYENRAVAAALVCASSYMRMCFHVVKPIPKRQ